MITTSIERLKVVSNLALATFQKISENCPDLKKHAYLVFSNPLGQCSLPGEMFQLLKEFPEALEPQELVTQVGKLIVIKKKNESEGVSSVEISNEIRICIEKLQFRSDVFVELRWNPGNLDYQLISEVIQSPLISKELTRNPMAPVLFAVKDV